MYGNTCFNDTYHILWTNLFIHFTISYLRLVWIKTPLEALPLASFFFYHLIYIQVNRDKGVKLLRVPSLSIDQFIEIFILDFFFRFFKIFVDLDFFIQILFLIQIFLDLFFLDLVFFRFRFFLDLEIFQIFFLLEFILLGFFFLNFFSWYFFYSGIFIL